MSEPCNEVHARIIASEARTPPAEEWVLTSLGGLRPNVAIDSAEALKTEGDLDLPVRENTVSLLSGLVEDMELNSDMKLRLNEAAQLLAPKQLVTEVIRRSCEATTSGYFGIKRIADEVKCPYCFGSDYLWTTPKLSTEEANAVTYERQLIAEAEDAVAEEQTAQNEDQRHNEPMGSEASCSSDEDQSQTRLNRQPKHLEDFVRLRSAMRMFHRRRASF